VHALYCTACCVIDGHGTGHGRSGRLLRGLPFPEKIHRGRMHAWTAYRSRYLLQYYTSSAIMHDVASWRWSIVGHERDGGREIVRHLIGERGDGNEESDAALQSLCARVSPGLVPDRQPRLRGAEIRNASPGPLCNQHCMRPSLPRRPPLLIQGRPAPL
jgi:hypothetical protein